MGLTNPNTHNFPVAPGDQLDGKEVCAAQRDPWQHPCLHDRLLVLRGFRVFLPNGTTLASRNLLCPMSLAASMDHTLSSPALQLICVEKSNHMPYHSVHGIPTHRVFEILVVCRTVATMSIKLACVCVFVNEQNPFTPLDPTPRWSAQMGATWATAKVVFAIEPDKLCRPNGQDRAAGVD